MRRRVRGLALELWLPVALFAGWWLLSADNTSPFWPPLRKILVAFRENWLFSQVGSQLVPSLVRIGEGFGLAVAIGLGLGLMLGSSPTLRRALEPTLEFIRALPVPAILPVAIIVFGIGNGEKVFVIVFACMWPILLNTIDGIAGVDPIVLDVTRVYRLSARSKVLDVVLPAAMPRIFVGLRLAVSYALLAIVLAELFASTEGLGYFILNAQNTFRIDDMWSGIFVIALLAYAVSLLFALLERRVLSWHRGWRASALDEPAEAGPARTPWHQRFLTRPPKGHEIQ